jgi:hypothetical protein
MIDSMLPGANYGKIRIRKQARRDTQTARTPALRRR